MEIYENLREVRLNMANNAPFFISKDGFGITHEARKYLLPLIAGEDYPSYENGLPHYPKLQNKLITKRCKQWALP